MRIPSIPPTRMYPGANEAPIDGTLPFMQHADALWLALQEWRSNTSDLSAQAFLTQVNNMYNYLNGLGTITQANNPQAFAIWTDLTTKIGFNPALKDIANNFTADTVHTLEGSSSLYQFDQLASDCNVSTTQYSDKTKKDLQNYVEYLKDAIAGYNFDKNQDYPDPLKLQGDLVLLAKRINDLQTYVTANPISDGFLTPLLAALNYPLVMGKTDTFATLATAVTSKVPPDQSALDALAASLKNGDLQWVINKSESEEYH
jgi:hypothetical protein